jgi:hypothetical protein
VKWVGNAPSCGLANTLSIAGALPTRSGLSDKRQMPGLTAWAALIVR